VYVTGRVAGFKIFVARINAAGQREWLRSYDSLSGVVYLAASLAVDPSGNVLVAGVGGVYNWWSGQGVFMQMMKYNAAGNLLWAREYTDPQNARVKASDIVVDRLGNAYVTGSSGQWYSEPPFMGDSIITLKYDANGVSQWVEHYSGVAGSKNEASSVLVDVVGNVLVAGASGPKKKSDFLTIRYQPSGNKEWEAHASGEGASFESLSAMTVDATGNVYVTGSSIAAGTSSDYITAKFDPSGNKLWSARYDSPEHGYDHPTTIVVDALGNVYVTGSGRERDASSYVTVKYSPNGVQQWVERYFPTPAYSMDFPYNLEVDRSGNVYVGGSTGLVKYDYNGIEQWRSADTVYAATLDRQNSLYISTWTRIIKIDTSGVRQTLLYTAGNDFAVDDSGNVYVTKLGWYPGPYSNQTQKFSPSGSLVWSLNRGGENLCLDDSGNVLVRESWTWNDTVAFKINGAGMIEWCAVSVGWSGPIDFAFDGLGNLYLCGLKWSGSYFGESDFYAVKYNSSGALEWSARYNGPGNSSETPYVIAVGGSGAVYIAGATERDDFSTKITLVKYSQVTVSVNEGQPEVPVSYSLSQNYPNPFNPSTTIRFALPKSGLVELRVYNTLGQEVATLVNEERNAGTYSAQWNAGSLASGVYFYRLEVGSFVDTKKLLLVK
jgi:hypothetical protein